MVMGYSYLLQDEKTDLISRGVTLWAVIGLKTGGLYYLEKKYMHMNYILAMISKRLQMQIGIVVLV